MAGVGRPGEPEAMNAGWPSILHASMPTDILSADGLGAIEVGHYVHSAILSQRNWRCETVLRAVSRREGKYFE